MIMEEDEILLDSENLPTEINNAVQVTERQRQLAARKRIEDYIAEKQLRENIDDFDY